MKNRDFKDSRLIDAFSYIDPKYIAEVTDSLKLSNNSAAPIIAKRRSWRHIAALAACMLLLGALIPMITYVLRNFGDIAAWFTEDTTEESNTLTEPETPPEETTATPPETTEEETTAEETTAEETTAEETTAPPETTECTHSLYTATENVPTCTESATVNYQCSSCGHTWSEVLPALGHNFVNNICTRCGLGIEYDGSRGLEYVVEGNYAVLTGIGTCTDRNIVVASSYMGYPVKYIGWGAFEKNADIKSVVIPEGIETIVQSAFRECSALVSVSLPESVKSIGDYAFYICPALSEINLPNGLESIGKNAFAICTSLTQITIPESISVIKERTFYECSSLKQISIPESVTRIEDGVFKGCSGISDLYIPKNVTYIGELNFQDVEKFTIDPENPKYSSKGNCFIDKETKTLLKMYENSVLPDDGSIEIIGKIAIDEYLPIKELILPEGVRYICEGSLAAMEMLEYLHLPSTFAEYEQNSFSHFLALKKITIADGNPKYYVNGNCLIERASGTVILGTSESVIPSDGSIEHIGAAAFAGNKNLKSIVIPEGVVSIQVNAFASCSSLNKVTIPKSLERVGTCAFMWCASLKSIELGDNVKYIEPEAFAGCKELTTVILPKQITSIGHSVFSGCESLESVILPEGVNEIDRSLFGSCSGLVSLIIPKSVTKIEKGAFANCQKLSDLVYSGTVREWNGIQKESGWNDGCSFTVIHCSDGDVKLYDEPEYDGSRGLEYEISSDGKFAILVGIGTCTDKDIVIASTYNGIPVARIDSYALYNCQFIESVTISEGVTIIHNEAFYLCKNLKKVTLPSTLEWIQDWAFAGCESLETVRIPDSVTQISIRAFSDCKNLFSLTLGAGVELIEESAFENCTSLGYVKFPKSLRLLANDAFAGCTALTNIHYAGTIREWNSVDSTGRDYGNTHVWYEGVPGEKITCTNGYIFISPISENEAYEAAREFLGIPKSQIGGKYVFATKTKDSSHLYCYRVAYCEWKSDVGYMGQYEVLSEVYVNQNTGECTEIVFDYPDIPEVFHGVIFNREKFIYVDRYSSNATEERYLKTFEHLPSQLFGAESQSYGILDIDGDSTPELIFSDSTLSGRGLILRYYEGKIYGYSYGGDGLMTDGTNPWHENAGEVQVLDLIYFDGLLFKSREIMRYDFSDPQNVKYYVEGKEVTKEEYEKTAAKYDGEYLKYSPLDLYPVYVNPFPGG